MEVVSSYVDYLFKKEYYKEIIICLNFYKKCLEIYHQRKQRNQDSKTLKLIYNHINILFSLKNGAISKLLLNN